MREVTTDVNTILSAPTLKRFGMLKRKIERKQTRMIVFRLLHKVAASTWTCHHTNHHALVRKRFRNNFAHVYAYMHIDIAQRP